MTFIFLFNKDHHGFAMKLQKSEADPRWRLFFFFLRNYDFGTKSQKSETDLKWRPFFWEHFFISGEHHDFETKIGFGLRIPDNFLSYP